MRYVAIFVAGFAAGAVLFHCAQAFGKPLDRRLERCMVYLPDMPDAKLRRWCLAQSKRMP